MTITETPSNRDVVSVSTSRSRDGLETYRRLVSVSSRSKSSLSRSRLGLGHLGLVSRLGLAIKGLDVSVSTRRLSRQGVFSQVTKFECIHQLPFCNLNQKTLRLGLFLSPDVTECDTVLHAVLESQ